ncbi:MAG: LysE family translocator [Pseudomonadota bacterium]
MLTFTGAVLLLIITPGPGVLTTAGIGSSYGWPAGLRFLAGLFIGTNLGSIFVITGLAALVLADPMVRTILVWGSILYFLWLALKIAFAGGQVRFMHPERPPRVRDGIFLQLINPKLYSVNAILFGGFAFWGGTPAEILMKLAIMNILWVPVHFLWLGAGVGLRHLALSAGWQRVINIGMALSLMAVVGLSASTMLSQSHG